MQKVNPPLLKMSVCLCSVGAIRIKHWVIHHIIVIWLFTSRTATRNFSFFFFNAITRNNRTRPSHAILTRNI